MKAIQYTRYGSPDVLQFKEVNKPVLKDNQVLIKVYAASANPADWHMMRGKPFLVHMQFGLLRPKHPALGVDLAGRIEAVGSAVTHFRPGDEVFGVPGSGVLGGSFAEYTAADEDRVTLKPANLSFEDVAAVPVAGVTALQGLRDYGQIKGGQKVLVNGAAGGVGTFAVQIAKSFGTEVTGVCSTPNLDMVRTIGADHVIDYTKEDFSKNGQRYDLILDAVANHSVTELSGSLTPTGVLAVVGFGNMFRLFQTMLLGPRMSKPSGKKFRLVSNVKINSESLDFLKGLLETGKIRPVIDRCYPLGDTANAIRYLETGHARGKVVVEVA